MAVKRAGRKGNTGAFYVNDYGAVGDGVTDDRAAFLAAINAAAAASGGEVRVPQGTFVISSTIAPSAQKNISIVGQGWQSSKILCTTGFISASNNSDQWTIRGLHIASSAATNTQHGIRVDIPRRWLITQCYFTGFGGDSVRYDAGLHSEVSFNYFSAKDSTTTNGHAAIYITVSGAEFSTTMTTRHNYISESKNYGILFDHATSCSSHSDVLEYCAVGMRFDNCSAHSYNAYFENNTVAWEFNDSSVTQIGPNTQTAPVVTWSGAAAASRVITKIDRDDVTFGPLVSVQGGTGASPTLQLIVGGALRGYLLYNGGSDVMRLDSDGSITFAPNNAISLTLGTDGSAGFFSTTSDPSAPPDGSIWYRSDHGNFSAMLDGSKVELTPSPIISFPSNAWHKAGQAGSVSAAAPTANEMFLLPLWPGRKCSIAQLSYEITTQGVGAAGTDELRLGIYNAGTDGLPTGAPLVDYGKVDLEAVAGVKVFNPADQALDPKLYWLAAVRQVSGVNTTPAQLRLQTGDNANYRVLKDTQATPTIGTSGGGYGMLIQTGVSGALPTIGTLALTTDPAPIVLVQFA